MTLECASIKVVTKRKKRTQNNIMWESKELLPTPSADIYLLGRLRKQDAIVSDDSDRIAEYPWKSCGVARTRDGAAVSDEQSGNVAKVKKSCTTNLSQGCLRKKPWTRRIYCRPQFWQWSERCIKHRHAKKICSETCTSLEQYFDLNENY